MELFRTGRFKKDFKRLDRLIQDRVITTLEQFLANPSHPSLRVKKMEGTPDVWELRVSENVRITYQHDHGVVYLKRVGTHDILRHP